MDDDAPDNAVTADDGVPNAALCEASHKARQACWGKVGRVDSDVLSHIINPAFMGGPRWPALRQAFAVIRRPETQTVVLASDGLSDPFDGTCTRTSTGQATQPLGHLHSKDAHYRNALCFYTSEEATQPHLYRFPM
jgi:hypothetical protein